MTAPTIRPSYRCAWDGKKISDPNLKAKKHYCSDRCRELHDQFIKRRQRTKSH